MRAARARFERAVTRLCSPSFALLKLAALALGSLAYVSASLIVHPAGIELPRLPLPIAQAATLPSVRTQRSAGARRSRAEAADRAWIYSRRQHALKKMCAAAGSGALATDEWRA